VRFAALAGRFVRAGIALALMAMLAACGDAPEGPSADPLIYEIAASDGAVEGWMLGTIHALPSGTRWKTPAIKAAIAQADLLVVEIAALDDRAGMAATFAELATTPGLPPLAERVPPPLSAPLGDLIERGGLPLARFADTETWAAAIMLAQVDAVGDPANGVDRALLEDFAGRPVRELEGARAQLAIFDRLPEADQRAMLAAILREAERNRRWAAALGPLLGKAPRPLIAVGTAHLIGPEGLASLLAAQGYKVRRLP